MPFFSKLFLVSRLLSGPLEILFTLLIFILNKNLEVLPLQLTLLATIKPISSLFSFYISSIIFDNPHRIRIYLILNVLAGILPCFIFPFTDNVWFYIAAYGVFIITKRAVEPAWIEVLKQNVDSTELAKTVSKGNSLYCMMTIICSPLICYFLDEAPQLWRYFFLCLALLKLMNIAIVFAIRSDMVIQVKKPFVEPIKKGLKLLRERPAFTHYLALYFLGGVGIIATQSILPLYFKNELNLSYSQLGMAFSFCKGLSYIFASSYWTQYIQKASLYRLNALANLFTVAYFILLIAASEQTSLLYLAYLSYGLMQSGCDLSKDTAGPLFSGSNESTIYSSLNLAFTGIRGCIFPALGSLLYAYTGSFTVFTVAALICLLGSLYGVWLDRRYPVSKCPKTLLRSYA